MKTALVRVFRGANRCTVHMADCPQALRAKDPIPWEWAEGRHWNEVFQHQWNVPGGCCDGRIYSLLHPRVEVSS